MSTTNFYFNPEATGPAVFMGTTEAQLMELVWKHSSLTVKRVLVLIVDNPKPAYTTIMTILNRLVAKKLLKRSKDGRHYIYTANINRDDFLAQRLEIVNRCLATCLPSQN